MYIKLALIICTLLAFGCSDSNNDPALAFDKVTLDMNLLIVVTDTRTSFYRPSTTSVRTRRGLHLL